MPVKASKPEHTVGEKVIMVMEDGEEIPVEITKLKGDNFVVEDDQGTTYECEPHEIKPLKKKAKKEEPEEEEEKPVKKKKAEPEEPEEEETPKKSKKSSDKEDDGDSKPAKKKSWSDFKAAEKNKAMGMPVGNWEALAFNGLAEEDEKTDKVTAYVEYVGVGDEAVSGVTQRGYYSIRDDNGSYTEGVGYWKRDMMELLGLEEDEIDEAIDDKDPTDGMNSIMKKLRKKEPWASIRVKKGKGDNNNLYLQGLMDDQDEKPKNPLADQKF